jgi:hypothetical protein
VKSLNSPFKFMAYALWQSIRHPKTPIRYAYCPDCKLRVNAKETQCPACKEKIKINPEVREISPVPWYVSLIIIVLGIISTCLGCVVPILGLDEAGKAMIYIPLGSLFGMSIRETP